MVNLDELLSIRQAAARRGVTTSAIYNLIVRHRLEVVEVMGVKCVRISELDALVPIKPGRKTI